MADEISYCDIIPYKEYLRIVAESKCILEIMQKGGTGNTIRVSEAIAMDKLLLLRRQNIEKISSQIRHCEQSVAIQFFVISLPY